MTSVVVVNKQDRKSRDITITIESDDNGLHTDVYLEGERVTSYPGPYHMAVGQRPDHIVAAIGRFGLTETEANRIDEAWRIARGITMPIEESPEIRRWMLLEAYYAAADEWNRRRQSAFDEDSFDHLTALSEEESVLTALAELNGFDEDNPGVMRVSFDAMAEF